VAVVRPHTVYDKVCDALFCPWCMCSWLPNAEAAGQPGWETALRAAVASALCSPTQRQVASVTYKCWRGVARASIAAPETVPKITAKIGCRFQMRLEIFVSGDSEPEVRPVVTAPHNGHERGCAEDALLLQPASALEERAKELLGLGLRPMQVNSTCAVRGCQFPVLGLCMEP
jgi:hypothetical protein